MSRHASAQRERFLARPAAIVSCTAVILAATGAVAAVTAVVPGLAQLSRQLLPTHLDGAGLDHALGQVVALVAHNGAIVAALLAAAALRTRAGRLGRALCDALAVSIVARSILLVGFVLGGQGTDLLPFLIHLPLEWAALAAGTVAWRRSFDAPLTPSDVAHFAAAAACALLAAATLETYATPRPHGGAHAVTQHGVDGGTGR